MDQSSSIVPFARRDEQVASAPVDTPTIQRLKSARQRRAQARYVKGPLPWSVITTATKAHPKGLALYLGIKMLADTTGKTEVTVSNQICADLGLGREMKRRILKALAAAGMVKVRQNPGQLARVRLLGADPGSGGKAESQG